MAKINISRRTMILGGLLGGGLVVIGGSLYWMTGESVEDMIKRRLGYLKLNDGVVAEFANAFRASQPAKATLLQRVMQDPGKAIRAVLSGSRGLGKLSQAEERVCTMFLFSTDFFQTGADVNRRPNYLYFADPYASPCTNAVAKFG